MVSEKDFARSNMSSTSTQSTRNDETRHACQPTQSASLGDTAATDTTDMLQLSTDAEKLALYEPPTATPPTMPTTSYKGKPKHPRAYIPTRFASLPTLSQCSLQTCSDFPLVWGGCNERLLTPRHSARLNTVTSPLLRLPAEIRNTIYHLALGPPRNLHTQDAASRKLARQRDPRPTRTNALALLSVCRQLYVFKTYPILLFLFFSSQNCLIPHKVLTPTRHRYRETHLLPFTATHFTFHALPLFSKYMAQTLRAGQIGAITVLKCPFSEIYFPGFGVNAAFINLLRGSMRRLKMLVLMGVGKRVLRKEDMKSMEKRIAREIEEECGGLVVGVWLTRRELERRVWAPVYSGLCGRSMSAE
jgi:hypothetical protein